MGASIFFLGGQRVFGCVGSHFGTLSPDSKLDDAVSNLGRVGQVVGQVVGGKWGVLHRNLQPGWGCSVFSFRCSLVPGWWLIAPPCPSLIKAIVGALVIDISVSVVGVVGGVRRRQLVCFHFLVLYLFNYSC